VRRDFGAHANTDAQSCRRDHIQRQRTRTIGARVQGLIRTSSDIQIAWHSPMRGVADTYHHVQALEHSTPECRDAREISGLRPHELSAKCSP